MAISRRVIRWGPGTNSGIRLIYRLSGEEGAVSLENNEPRVTVEDRLLTPEEELVSSHPEPTMALEGEDNTDLLGRTIEVSLELSSKSEKTLESGVAIDPDPALGHPDSSSTFDSSSTDASTTEKLLPAHLQSMFEDAKKDLTMEQVELVQQALIEFTDVFVINDLDIGKFTALVHYIRTGQALPIKQSMRRTPLGFGAQERTTLERMLEAEDA